MQKKKNILTLPGTSAKSQITMQANVGLVELQLKKADIVEYEGIQKLHFTRNKHRKARLKIVPFRRCRRIKCN